ncbi:hypothetical protein B0H34DRAFT_743346 [Crassisporium funariophilum]|nr:hypothetical protein B0H34DRAFT_743346 [Crassisporium funariophilum]
MGKWTPDYVDDVLHSKISSLVTGAIRRAAVEKEPSISYEHFVNELDSGDSFTASLLDILVKEVADRRTRANVDDRRLIADRTIRSLRTLANSNRAYPSRLPNRHARRTVNLSEYLTVPPNEMEMEDEDDQFDNMHDNTTVIEGVRTNADLYDAFSANAWPPSNARRITASPSPVSDEWAIPPSLRSPTTTSASRPWSTLPTASTTIPSYPTSNLSRQASVRRAARSRLIESRTVDFNEHTRHRRSSNREALGTRGDTAESVTEPRDGFTTWNRAHARRFFPLSRTRRHEGGPTWAEFSDLTDPELQYIAIEPTIDSFFEGLPSRRASPDSDTRLSREDEEPLIRAPRLRRGGVRAPESMLSRHASPITINTPPLENTIVTPTPRPDENNSPAGAGEEPVAYPTPGSTENENLT